MKSIKTVGIARMEKDGVHVHYEHASDGNYYEMEEDFYFNPMTSGILYFDPQTVPESRAKAILLKRTIDELKEHIKESNNILSGLLSQFETYENYIEV